MAITINAKKVFLNKKRLYKITRIKALMQHELPIEYLEGVPRCYQLPDGSFEMVLSGDEVVHIENPRGHISRLTPTGMDTLIRAIEDCGTRLMKINQFEDIEYWEGSVEINI
jgi:hypothetical protein